MRGIHTALVTPFDARDALDLEAFRDLCTRQIDAGVHGLVVGGLAGEVHALAAEEWRQLVRSAVEASGGRVAVTAGVGAVGAEEAVARLGEALSLGVDSGLLVLPQAPESPDTPWAEAVRLHVAAATSAGLPLVLHHAPGRDGAGRCPAELLADLAAIDGVIGVQEGSGDLRYTCELRSRRRGDVTVLADDDALLLPLLSVGGLGAVSTAANVEPAAFVALLDDFEAGQHRDAAERLRRLWPLLRFVSDPAHAPAAACKGILAERGLCGRRVRAPLTPLADTVPAALVSGGEVGEGVVGEGTGFVGEGA